MKKTTSTLTLSRYLCSLLVAVIMSSFVSMTVHAENNISLGFSPYGFTKMKWMPKELPGYYYNLNYNKSWNGNISYEYRKKSLSFLAEFSYGQAKLNKFESVLTLDYAEPKTEAQFDKNLKTYGGALYLGLNFFSGSRLQFPLYVGVAYDQNKCEEYNLGFVSFASKVRMRFYIVNNASLYVGANYKFGVEPEAKADNINWHHFTADAGVIFSF